MPHQKGVRKEIVTMTPDWLKRKPPQTEPHVIPDDTEARSPVIHPYNGSTFNIPLVHIYNTRARRMKVHNLMVNNVVTVQPHKPPQTSVHEFKIHRTG